MKFTHLKSGLSVEKNEIKAFRSLTEKEEKSYAYFMAGVHGDEVEGIFILQKLYEWLQDQENLNGAFIIIPIVNPDGYRLGSRTNAHGVDLNRNLDCQNWSSKAREDRYCPGPHPMSEPENQFLAKLFQSYPPHLIVSFHSWKPMLNHNGDCKEIAQFLHSYNSYPIYAEEIEGHPTPGSLGNYAPEKYNCPVLTFEAPVINEELSLENIWEQNCSGLQALVQSHLVKPKNQT